MQREEKRKKGLNTEGTETGSSQRKSRESKSTESWEESGDQDDQVTARLPGGG